MIKIVSSVLDIKPPKIEDFTNNHLLNDASTDTQIMIPTQIAKKSEINKNPAQSPSILLEK
jgi:hypothetical protein